MTYPPPPNGQPYYPPPPGCGQQVPPQGYEQAQYTYTPPQPPRVPSPYGWGIWVTIIGAVMLFAGIAAPTLATATSSVDCSSLEQRVEWLTGEYEAAKQRRAALPPSLASTAADRTVTEASKARSEAILERDRCNATANTEAANGIGGVALFIGSFAPLVIGIGLTRILAGGDLMTRVGSAVHRRWRAVRAARPARQQFAPVPPQPQPVYEQPQYAQEYPAYDDDEPAPEPEPERPREGWGNRRNLNFGGDD